MGVAPSQPEAIQSSGLCKGGCGLATYDVCDRGKPAYGPDGRYCPSCWDEANRDIFGEE